MSVLDLFPKNKLGCDTIRVPLLDKSDVTSVDVEQLKEMVDYLMAHGCNLFFTSWPYRGGACEVAMKAALVDRYPRDSYVLVDDMPTYNLYNPGDAERMFAESMDRLGVDHFDLFLTHAARLARIKNCEKVGALDFFRSLKKTGKAKYLGLGFIDSPENLEEALKLLGDEIDVVQILYNFFDADSAAVRAEECLEICRKYNKPVIAMETNRGGYLCNPSEKVEALLKSKNENDTAISWSLRHAASQPGVALVLNDMTDMDRVKECVAVMENFQPITEEDEKLLKEVAQTIRDESPFPCINCGACVEGCPVNINIPAMLDIQNTWEKLHDNEAFVHYILHTDTAKRGHANECVGCGLCSSVCPRELDIPEILKKVSATFDNDLYRGFINY